MKRGDKELAVKHGISKALRQYAKRYGSSVEQMIAEMKKYAVRKK